MKGKPIHLTFFVTRKCNSGCPFCFYLRGAGDPDSRPELSIDEIYKISRSLGNLLWLAFSGGEIFLRQDLAEISNIFYSNNKPSIMLFPTNGLMSRHIASVTEQILRQCSKSVVVVKLSIDGLYSAHDRLRNTPGGFDKTMETYRLLAELLHKYPNFELGVNTVFCSQNQDNMDEIIDFVGSLTDIKTHTISLVRGDLSNSDYKNVDLDMYNHAISRLERNLKDKHSKTYRFKGARIKAAQDIMQRRLIHRTRFEGKRIIPCYAGRLNLVLSESGNVYPCEVIPEPFGNVRDYGYDIFRVSRSERAKAALTAIASGRCFCTHECYFMTNILFNPGLYPQLARELIQLK